MTVKNKTRGDILAHGQPEIMRSSFEIEQKPGSHGVGQLVPIATNDTAEGQAKNRRVELVKQ